MDGRNDARTWLTGTYCTTCGIASSFPMCCCRGELTGYSIVVARPNQLWADTGRDMLNLSLSDPDPNRP
jgi:hypothetical protein